MRNTQQIVERKVVVAGQIEKLEAEDAVVLVGIGALVFDTEA